MTIIASTDMNGRNAKPLASTKVFVTTDTTHARLLDDVASRLAALGAEVKRGPSDPSLITHENLTGFIGDADVAGLTIRQAITRDHLGRLPRLSGLCLPVTGVESVDLAAATELGVLVGHGATVLNSIGMAEATVLLALAMLYNLPAAQSLMAGGVKPDVPRARLAQGKTMGLIGYGRIASAVADRLRPFGTHLLTFSPTTAADRIPPDVSRVDLDTLMRESDVVIVLATLTAENRAMLRSRELALMKSTAFLVNTARGALIDEAALIEALAGNRIAGAALDTFAAEPLSMTSPLRRLPNVILTPHMIGHTQEGSAEFASVMAENMSRLLLGEPPLHCKNPEAIPAWRKGRAARADVTLP